MPIKFCSPKICILSPEKLYVSTNFFEISKQQVIKYQSTTQKHIKGTIRLHWCEKLNTMLQSVPAQASCQRHRATCCMAAEHHLMLYYACHWSAYVCATALKTLCLTIQSKHIEHIELQYDFLRKPTMLGLIQYSASISFLFLKTHKPYAIECTRRQTLISLLSFVSL